MRKFNVILTCFAFLFILASCVPKEKRIGFQPYGEFDKALIDTVVNALASTYGYEIIILPKRKIPKNAFVNIKSPRYRADSLLIDLKVNKPDSIDIVLGLINKDISTTKRDATGNVKKPESKYFDWGIYGLGYRPGPSCIVSTYRLNTTNKKLFFSRLKKICIHEVGHNLGLPHCTTNKCVMQDAVETIKTVDNESDKLCAECRLKIEN